MPDMGMRTAITILGARGTMPVEGQEVSRYGGGTSCVLVRMGGEVIVLDAGTGIMDLGRVLGEKERSLHLLLSHPHFDHIAGLPSCPIFFLPDYTVCIHAAPHGGRSPRQQVECLMGPPLWPVGPDAFRADVSYRTIGGAFSLGAVSVKIMEGVHPGGCTMFRLECGDKSVVYASDYELDQESFARLADFSKDCSLLLCDGQYTEEEFRRRRGYGHSSWQAAAKLGRESGARRLLITHHAPWRRDEELEAVEPLLQKMFSSGAFARGGEEITI